MLEEEAFRLGGMQAGTPAAVVRTPYAHLTSRRTNGGISRLIGADGANDVHKQAGGAKRVGILRHGTDVRAVRDLQPHDALSPAAPAIIASAISAADAARPDSVPVTRRRSASRRANPRTAAGTPAS